MIEYREAAEDIGLGQVAAGDRMGRIVLADASTGLMLGIAVRNIARGQLLAWDTERGEFVDDPPFLVAKGSIRGGVVMPNSIYGPPKTWRDRPPLL